MKFSIPYKNFKLSNEPIRQKLLKAFEETLDAGKYIQGPNVSDFEIKFAKFCQSSYATGLSNGTCALHLTLRELNLKDGDEIITVPNSFVASTSTIHLAGAKPVFVDVNEDMNINVDKIEEMITKKTKAIIPVHLAGRPCRIDKICELGKKYSIFILEDAAQSVGAKLNEKKVGSFGDAACFSLHPLKNLHAFGDAGILVSNNKQLVENMRIRKNHGLSSRDSCEYWSFNCRLDDVQASLLSVQLSVLEDKISNIRKIAFNYNNLLKNYVKIPHEAKGEYHTYQTYMVLAEERDKLQQFLVSNGVEALVHYPTPIHMQPAAKELNYKEGDFPITLELSKKILSLPIYLGITYEQQEYIASLFKKFYG